MRELLITFMSDNAGLIVFLHVLSAIIWIGGMIAIRVAVHPTMQKIDEPKVKMARSLELVGRFFNFVMPFIFIILFTGFVMAVGFNFKAAGGNIYSITHIKEGIWTLMAINYGIMYAKRKKAEQLFLSGDIAGAAQKMAPIPKYMLPLNIFLGLLGLLFGITLRGF